MPDDVCVYSMRPTCCCDLAEPPQKSTNKLGRISESQLTNSLKRNRHPQ